MTLSLLDNDDLNHKLLWVSASEKMRTEDNLQLLFRNKKRLEQAFPDYKDIMPASPEKLCSGFSNALGILEPDLDIEQQLLGWFITHIQSEADKLWTEVEKLLNDAGVADIEDKTNRSLDEIAESEYQPAFSATAAGKGVGSGSGGASSVIQGGSIPQSATSSTLFDLSDIMDPELMDSLAERLVLRVEDMLVQDEIIPEAKMGRIRSIDLATVLNTLQFEVTNQHLSIISLADSVKTALQSHEGRQKLSRRHEDLINIVGLLFEYILDDHQLPETIKKEIALLQIPILKLAIFDHEFLTDREHPARLLLNEMTSAGMSCVSELAFADPVRLLIESTVKTIIAESHEDLAVFQRSLESFRFEIALICSTEIMEPEENTDILEEVQANTEDIVLHETPDDVSPAPELELELELELNIDDAGFEEEIILESNINTLPTNRPESDIEEETTEDGLPVEIDSEQGEPAMQSFVPIEGIRTGQWVEFVGEGESHRMRCRLARILKESDHYIFENRSGMRVAEYTGRQLQKEIDQETIRVLEDHMIFDRALQAVMEKFKKK